MDEQEDATLVTPDDDYAAGAADAVDVLGTALLVFAVVSGLAGLFAIGQAVSRQVDAAVAGTTVLPALGFTTWRWAVAAALPSIAAVTLGVVLAPIGAGLLSGLYPIGFADELEPDPGLRIDLPVLLGGALVSLAVISGIAVWAGRRRCLGLRVRSWAPTWPWAWVTLAAGGRLAFGRGRSRASGPMRSAMLGVAIAVIGVVGSSTVLLSLDDLLEDPDRWGYPFSATGQVLDPSQLEAVGEEVAQRDDIDAVAILEQGLVRSSQEEIGLYAYRPIEGEIEHVIRRGRAPTADDEIAVGEAELDRLDLDLGDPYVVTDGEGEEHELEVVGASVTPAFNDLRPAQGTVVTPDAMDELSIVDPIPILAVVYADGADPDVIADAALPLGLGLLEPVLPTQLSNLEEADVVIEGLIAFFAVLGVIALLQGLGLSLRRHRQNLAVWRALGMVPSEIRRSVLWQSVLGAAVGVLAGVPLGLYAGRVAWRLAIQSVGVLDVASLPLLTVGLAVAGAFVVAVALGVVPAWLAARGQPASVLHAE